MGIIHHFLFREILKACLIYLQKEYLISVFTHLFNQTVEHEDDDHLLAE